MRDELKSAADALEAAYKAVRDLEYKLSNFELLDGANPIIKADWMPRDVTPPLGRIWASDGDGIWLISGDGNPIPATATSVKYWTKAFIPCPPNHRPIIDLSAANSKLLK